MTTLLIQILSFVFALGVIIVVHEAGHLLVAKAFDVRVLTFSVGFGRKLWSIQRGETEYRVSAVPLGGYVRLGGESIEEATGNDPREFLSKPRWQRVLVYLAGPAMNVVLAIAIFAGLFMVGIEAGNPTSIPPVGMTAARRLSFVAGTTAPTYATAESATLILTPRATSTTSLLGTKATISFGRFALMKSFGSSLKAGTMAPALGMLNSSSTKELLPRTSTKRPTSSIGCREAPIE